MLKQFESTDGNHRVAIFHRPEGTFGFTGQRLATEDGETFWEPCDVSGTYATAEAAEAAARSEVVWLRDERPPTSTE